MENTERKRPASAYGEYRARAAHPRYRRTSPAPPRRDIREKILLQIIISGALFLMVLVVNMINIEPVRGFKTSLKTALAESISAEKLSEQWQGAGRYVTSVQNTVLTIFGEEPIKEEVVEAIPLPGAEPGNAEAEADVAANEGEGDRGVDFRVDEDLLGLSESVSKEESTQEKKQ